MCIRDSHEHRDSARFRHLGHLDGHLGEPAVEVAQRRAVEEAVDGGGGHLFRSELGPRGVNAGPRRSLAIDDDVRERGALTGLDDDVRGVHAVVAELVQDGFPGTVVGELGEDGGSQAESGDRGEGVAAVSATLRLEGVGAELLVGLWSDLFYLALQC